MLVGEFGSGISPAKLNPVSAADGSTDLDAVGRKQAIELPDVDVKHLAIFRTSGGIVAPHELAQAAGADSVVSVHDVVDAPLDWRQREIVPRHWASAAGAALDVRGMV
jgi:hypothetical protein